MRADSLGLVVLLAPHPPRIHPLTLTHTPRMDTMTGQALFIRDDGDDDDDDNLRLNW